MKVFYIDQKKSHPYIKEDSLASSAMNNITTHLPLHKTLPINIIKLVNVNQEFNQIMYPF